MSLGLGGGCDWLKNSSTCNIKFNQHLSIAKKKTQESETGITHGAFSGEFEALPGKDMSTGLGAGCDWLKNSSACNIKFNQHLSITKRTHTHTHTSLRRG